MDKPDILSRIDRQTGMTVPEGYFDQFASSMEQLLPEQEFESVKVLPRTWWQKVRPYAYLAAMFMGIWCMMEMFNLMRPDTPSSATNSELLAKVVNNESYFSEYYDTEIDETDVLYDMYANGVDPSTVANDLVQTN